jgi:hypothetical protein
MGLELRGAPLLGRLFGARRRQALDKALPLLEAVGSTAPPTSIPRSCPAACSSVSPLRSR